MVSSYFPTKNDGTLPLSGNSNFNGYPNGTQFTSQSNGTHKPFKPKRGHSRSISRTIGEGINRMRGRSGSVTAHEITDALKAPVSWKLVGLCCLWYLSSAFSNISAKKILNGFYRPVSLTIIQFAFVSGWCILLASLAKRSPGLRKAIPALSKGLRPPSKDVIRTTAPLAVFQVAGHITSSYATGRIAVSLVHTIKGMSPLFTVLAYRYIFGVRYSTATYISLIPLSIGVMLACSTEFRGNFVGIMCAFGSSLIFVWQNIVSKKIFNASNTAHEAGSKSLDKLNLLCYSSGMAFLLTFPLWLYMEGFGFIWQILTTGGIRIPLEEVRRPEDALSGFWLISEFFFNGTVHFGQNIIAFVLLSMVSPVTYSVASLFKRVAVILIAVFWFKNSTTKIQAFGIGLTFFGLYLYDKAGDVAKKERAAKLLQEKNDSILPMNAVQYSAKSKIPLQSYVQEVPEQPTYGSPPLQNGHGILVSSMESGLGHAGFRNNSAFTNQDESWRRQTAQLGA